MNTETSFSSGSADPARAAGGDATAPQAENTAFTRTSYVVQCKSIIFSCWDECMRYSTWELAYRSLPEWRKESPRALRVVRETTQVVWMDGEHGD